MDDARQLVGLEPGQFYVQGIVADPTFVKVRQRETKLGGATPTIKSRGFLDADLTSRSTVRAAWDLNKAEHARARLALDTQHGSRKVRYIPFDDDKVLKALNRNKQKHLFGKSDSVIDFELIMLPIFFVSIRERKERLLGAKFVDYKVLIDAISGELLSSDGTRRRSENLIRLADLTPIQLEVLDLILSNRKASYAKLREAFPGKRIKPSLDKLKEMHFIVEKDDVYRPWLPVSYPKSLASQSADALQIRDGRSDNVNRQRISKQQLNGLIRDVYPGCKVEGVDVIYSPVLEVIYASNSAERDVRIDTLTGKTLHTA
jgi:hypothetical protein